MLRIDDYLMSRLVTVGWQHGQEYGGEPVARMVMSVIANRVAAGWGSWLDVLDRIPQYSALVNQPTGTPQVWAPSFVTLLDDVEHIFSGIRNYSEGALYWADLLHIENPWFQEKILSNPTEHPRIGGQNTFTLFA